MGSHLGGRGKQYLYRGGILVGVHRSDLLLGSDILRGSYPGLPQTVLNHLESNQQRQPQGFWQS